MAGAGNNDSLGNLNWRDRCIELLEKVEEKNYAAKDTSGKTENLVKEKKKLEDNLKFIEGEIEKASHQLKEISDKDDKSIRSSLLKLYSLITKITFDIENPANELKGYVAGNSLEIFQFDTAKHSRQFIIDSLWSLIEVQLKQNGAKKHTIGDWLMDSLDCEQIKRQKLF